MQECLQDKFVILMIAHFSYNLSITNVNLVDVDLVDLAIQACFSSLNTVLVGGFKYYVLCSVLSAEK